MYEKSVVLAYSINRAGRCSLFWIALLGFAVLSLAPVKQSIADIDSLSANYAQYSAEDLFINSGLKTLLQQIPTSTATSFEDALSTGELPDAFNSIDPKHIRAAIRNAFKFETFNRYLVKELKNEMSQISRQRMLDWYETSIGERVKQAELDNSLLFAAERFEQYRIYLARYPASFERLKIIDKLDNTMRSTESAVDMMTNMQVAFNLSLSRFMPKDMQLSRQDIVAMVNEHQDQLLSEYRVQTREVLLFTYQDLNIDELETLNKMLATEAGREFVEAINNGIKKGMFAASLDLGDGLGALINDPYSNPGI